jgi:hypothetical protein
MAIHAGIENRLTITPSIRSAAKRDQNPALASAAP